MKITSVKERGIDEYDVGITFKVYLSMSQPQNCLTNCLDDLRESFKGVKDTMKNRGVSDGSERMILDFKGVESIDVDGVILSKEETEAILVNDYELEHEDKACGAAFVESNINVFSRCIGHICNAEFVHDDSDEQLICEDCLKPVDAVLKKIMLGKTREADGGEQEALDRMEAGIALGENSFTE